MRVRHKVARFLSTTLVLSLVTAPLAGCKGSASPDAAPSASAANAEANSDALWVKTSARVTYSKDVGTESSSSTETYQLDEAGNIVRQTFESGDEDFEQTFEHDENGWKTEEVYKTDAGTVENITYVNKYDSSGRLVKNEGNDIVEEDVYDREGNLKERSFTKFDYLQEEEKGSPLGANESTVFSKQIFNKDGTIASRFSTLRMPTVREYAYEYDSQNRPVSCVVTRYEATPEGIPLSPQGVEAEKISISYDSNGNVSRIETVGDQGTSVQEFTYTLVKNPSLAVRTNARLLILS